MIVEFSDFKGERRIPDLFPEIGTDDVANTATQQALGEFIEKYEREYLLQFLTPLNPPSWGEMGEAVSELYDYNDLPEEEKIDEEKNRLIKSLKAIIPNFIAFYWFKNETIQNTGIGAVIPNGSNSKRANNVERMVFVWNEMVDGSRRLYKDFKDSKDGKDSNDGLFPDRDIFKKINAWGI